MRVMPRIGSSVVVSVAALAVLGMTAVPASAATTVTKAQARAIAAKINFTAADFPGYHVTPYKPTASDRAENARLQKCIGGAPDLVDVSAAEFDNPTTGDGYSSETSFVASPAAVKKDASRIVSTHAQQCIKQEFAVGVNQEGGSKTKVSLSPINEPSVSGLNAVFGYRLAITTTIGGHRLTLHGYLLGFGRGNAEVSFTEFGPGTVSESSTNSLVATLADRAKHEVPASGFTIKG